MRNDSAAAPGKFQLVTHALLQRMIENVSIAIPEAATAINPAGDAALFCAPEAIPARSWAMGSLTVVVSPERR